MTNSNISKLAAGYQMQGIAKGNAESGKKTEDTGDMFSAMIGQMNLGLGQSMDLSKKPEASLTVGIGKSKASSDQKTPDFTSKSDTSRIKKAEDTSAAVKEKADALGEKTAEKISEVMEEELSVTEEELNEVLEELGLSFMDLLNPANLAQVVAELTGAAENSSLLLSEDFVNVMQAVNDITAELAAELGISTEELQNMLSETVQESGLFELTDDTASEQIVAETSEEDTQNAGILKQPEEENLQTVKSDISVEGADGAGTEEAGDNLRTLKEQVNLQENQEGSESNAGENSKENSKENAAFTRQETKNAGQPVFEANASHVMTQGQTAEVNAVPVTPVYTGAVNVSEILQQIAEFVKASASQDVTSLEMQLNPENLGKLYLQISATKEGNVTAQFAAQSQAVKEALETQIVELRQTLNQQGVKVDAIEVTVATHEFERNLEQNAEREKQQGQHEEKRQGRRSLNLNQLDGLSGLMSEEEMLAAKIMQENGNSMDVTA